MRRYAAALAVVAGATLVPSAPAFAQFVQRGPKLVGTGADEAAAQGSAVALSADGTTAIVGGPHDRQTAGAAWIWTRSGTTWAQQGSKLFSAGNSSGYVGTSVALSADGNTSIVGAPWIGAIQLPTFFLYYPGASWVFTRGGGSWTQESRLTGTIFGVDSNQGQSVALSADGNTAIVGGFSENGTGAVWIFVRDGTTWSQQGPELVGMDHAGGGKQGWSVALSADGNTAIVGSPWDNTLVGAAWVFTRSGSSWTQQGSKLTGPGEVGAAQFGTSVSISADGNTAAVGGPFDNAGTGAVWTFTRSGSTFVPFGSKIIGAGAVGSTVQHGSSASLSSHGDILIEGGPGDGGATATGASWVFTRTAGGWTPLGSKLVGTGAVDGGSGARQGSSVALSSDGLTAIVGGSGDNGGAGAVWIFTRPVQGLSDFDGDRRTDATVYRPSGDWATKTSSSGFDTSSVVHFAPAFGYVPLHADFDGDSREDPAFYNQSTANWKILLSGSGYTTILDINWGGAGYAAVPGDYDGDGKADIAVCNVRTGVWNILKSSTGYNSTMTVTLGSPGITPIGAQDFDGDRISDVAVYQPTTGVWSVLTSSSGFTTGFSVGWGGRGYTLVPGDYDGDGRADLGLYERATGWWYVLKSGADFTTALSLNWGGTGYLPVPGDYDGDGQFDLGVYQQSTGNWYVLQSSSNYTTTLQVGGWGADGDLPISTAIPVGMTDLLRAGDGDGDLRSEITVYNMTTGVWSSLTSSTGFTGATNRTWGGSLLAVGDYDGDGRADLATLVPAVYPDYPPFMRATLSSTLFTTTVGMYIYDGGYGNDLWVPVPGDYDGDGKTDFAIFDAAKHLWSQRLSGEGYGNIHLFGYGTGVAVPADYDGDGKTDVATYDGATGHWSVRLSSTNNVSSQTMSVGGAGWVPVPADYDGDGRADFVVYNTSTGQWYGLLSSTNYTTTININWGGAGYAPVMGDYDGDGKADLALYHQASGNWYILLSSSNYTTTIVRNWGGPGYLAMPAYP